MLFNNASFFSFFISSSGFCGSKKKKKMVSQLFLGGDHVTHSYYELPHGGTTVVLVG